MKALSVVIFSRGTSLKSPQYTKAHLQFFQFNSVQKSDFSKFEEPVNACHPPKLPSSFSFSSSLIRSKCHIQLPYDQKYQISKQLVNPQLLHMKVWRTNCDVTAPERG